MAKKKETQAKKPAIGVGAAPTPGAEQDPVVEKSKTDAMDAVVAKEEKVEETLKEESVEAEVVPSAQPVEEKPETPEEPYGLVTIELFDNQPSKASFERLDGKEDSLTGRDVRLCNKAMLYLRRDARREVARETREDRVKRSATLKAQGISGSYLKLACKECGKETPPESGSCPKCGKAVVQTVAETAVIEVAV